MLFLPSVRGSNPPEQAPSDDTYRHVFVDRWKCALLVDERGFENSVMSIALALFFWRAVEIYARTKARKSPDPLGDEMHRDFPHLDVPDWRWMFERWTMGPHADPAVFAGFRTTVEPWSRAGYVLDGVASKFAGHPSVLLMLRRAFPSRLSALSIPPSSFHAAPGRDQEGSNTSGGLFSWGSLGTEGWRRAGQLLQRVKDQRLDARFDEVLEAVMAGFDGCSNNYYED